MEVNKRIVEALEFQVNYYHLSPNDVNAIKEYIGGKGEIENAPSIKLRVYYGLGDIFLNLFGTEYEEQALRGYYFMYQTSPKDFFSGVLGRGVGYEICHKLNIPAEEIVSRNCNRLSSNIDGYGRFWFIKRLLQECVQKDSTSEIMQAHKYYSQAFETFLKQDNGNGSKAIIIRLILKAMKGLLLDESLTEYREEMEKVFNDLYDEKGKKVHAPTLMQGNRDYVLLRMYLMNLHLFLMDKVEWVKPFLQKQLEAEGGEFCEGQMAQVMDINENVKDVIRLIDDLDQPLEVKISYYAQKLLTHSVRQYGKELYSLLHDINVTHPEVVKETFWKLTEKHDKGSIALLSFLKAEGMEVSEEATRAIDPIFILHYVKATKENERMSKLERMQGIWMAYELLENARVEVGKQIRLGAYKNFIDAALPIQEIFWSQKGNILTILESKVAIEKIIVQAIEYENLGEAVLTPFLKAHQQEAEAVMKQKLEDGREEVISYVEAYYSEEIGFSIPLLVSVFNHRLKTVISFMEKFVSDKEAKVREAMQPLHKIKNKNMQEALLRVENKWDQVKHIAHINTCKTKEEVAAYIEKIYTTSHEKVIPYKNEVAIDEKDQILLKYYIAEYMIAKEIVLIPTCEALRSFIDAKTLEELTKNLYNRWLEDGADTKLKNIVIIYALSAHDGDITELKKQIDTWTENARGALAAFAVTAMALNGSSIALMLTDSISRKYKNKQVKGAAANAMDYVAKVRGVSKEALADKIVPNLGFDETRRQMLDYGPRKFKVTLTPELDLQIFDEEKGKVIKSLPKPTQKDDEEKATAAKAYLTGIKKQMKTVIATQKQRLSKALLSGRSWDKENWEQVFIKNPIMNGFAMSLIWGAYDESGVLLSTFRYMEDGSFNTVDEEEYDISEAVSFRLMHPLDLSEEEFEGWKEQLEDYEITQAVSQLDMPIYTLTEEERKRDSYISFADKEVYYGQILKVMEQYDWQKTEAMDAGRYDGYYYYDEITDIGMIMLFEGLFMGINPAETVKVEELVFCKGDISDKCYYFNKNEHKNIVIDPKDVPEKVLNFGLLVINTICKGKEEN